MTGARDQTMEMQNTSVQLKAGRAGLLKMPAIGILGAGRLGAAIAKRWHGVQGKKPSLWSRRYGDANSLLNVSYDEGSFSMAPIETIVQGESVYAAIPSSGVVELALANQAFRNFTGVLFIAGIDMPVEEIQKFIPAALIIRVAPFLLPTRKDVPSLMLVRGNGGTPRDARANIIMEALGPVDRIDNEKAFELLLYFGSPFQWAGLIARGTIAASAKNS